MELLPILLCMILISTMETTGLSIISKPKFNKPIPPDRAPLQAIARKLPEDRRKLSIFPKSSKKFVIKLESPVNENINARLRKRPLMKKIKFLNKEIDHKKDVIDSITYSPLTSFKPFNVNMVDMSRKRGRIAKGNEDEQLFIKEDSRKNNEINDIAVEEESQTEIYSINEEDTANRNIRDNKTKKRILDLETDSLSNEDDEKADLKEFIFINEGKGSKGSNHDLSTTAQPVKRVRRNDNVIEEENLVTTPSVHKYTWIDTRLTNDLSFKNIHS